jgi:hypothetical protein
VSFVWQEDWGSNTLASYTFDEGASTGLAVTGGYLTATSNGVGGSGINAGSPGAPTQQTTLKFQWNHATDAASFGAVLKRISANNFVMCQATGGIPSPSIQIYTRVSGTYTLKATLAISAKSQNTDYWVRGSISGNVVTIEFFTSDPYTGGTAAHSTNYTLTGADATSFGTGVPGVGGFRFGVTNAGDGKIDFVYFEQATTVALTPATETDTGPGVVARRLVTLTAATESDTARALSYSKPLRKSLTAATETDAAVRLGAFEVNPASETDAAVALSFTKPIHKSLTAAIETDSAPTLAWASGHQLSAPWWIGRFSSDVIRTLTPATESDSGVALSAFNLRVPSLTGVAVVVVSTDSRSQAVVDESRSTATVT